jgi:hypothetical protein
VADKSEKILTPEFRLSFPALFEAREFNGKKKFGCTMLFDKKADLKLLVNALLEAVKSELPKEYDKFVTAFKSFPDVPEYIGKFKQPFLNGDGREWEGYAGTVFIRASSLYQPGVIDRKKVEIIDPEEVYAGSYGRATVNIFVYPSKDGGKPGIGVGLRNYQKLRDGEKFSSRGNPESDFNDLPETTDDLDGLE